MSESHDQYCSGTINSKKIHSNMEKCNPGWTAYQIVSSSVWKIHWLSSSVFLLKELSFYFLAEEFLWFQMFWFNICASLISLQRQMEKSISVVSVSHLNHHCIHLFGSFVFVCMCACTHASKELTAILPLCGWERHSMGYEEGSCLSKEV